ncbi:hypothetical protein R1sor_014411 [Riccia sorocarpa]|uniref:Uncharacterized protein n=1 Tax=Riccia sorocarpa TaxID=122646 RepID=A0ABD3HBV7_9MARC
MAEQSGSTDPTEQIDQVLQAIPASSPIASGQEADTTLPTSCSVDPLAAVIAPTSPAAALVNSTPAIQKPVRGSQSKKSSTPALSAISPPTTRSVAGKKRRDQQERGKKPKDPLLGSVAEAEAQAESQAEGPTEPRHSLWSGDMASISAHKDDGGRESGAFSNIIHTYTMKFENNKPTPKIPLCRLVQFTRVRQFQTTSLQTEALKKSFKTHCYMEHFAAFHVSLFDENGNEMLIIDEDKAGWDMLWRMESQEFDAECSKIPKYQHLVNKKFSTWDGNHRLITWMQVSMSPERTTRKAWHHGFAGKKRRDQQERGKKPKEPLLGSVAEAEAQAESQAEGPTEPRHSLWHGDMASISAHKDDGGRESGAFSNIIHTYTMKFENNKPTPKIPLCRLVQFTRVRQFQTTSLQTEALKKSFKTHCYMEHFAAFHVSLFDENGNEMLIIDEDKAGWDMLWRMESQEFDAECSKIPKYQHLVNKKFSTWDGNHRLITWMQEFEKARVRSPAKTAWYHENMTSTAAAYILSFGEVSAAKDAQLVAEEEAKKQEKPLSSKQKKNMWDARVKEVCASWSSQVFKYATVVNPSLGPEFLAVVRELHKNLASIEKSKREVAHSVGLDRVKAFASAGIHNNLKIELLKVHYNDEKTREKYHHPAKFDVDNDLRPWLQQWALWSSLELLSCDIVRKIGIVRGPKEEDEEEKTARLEAESNKFRAYFEDVRDTYWTTIWYPIEDRQDVHLNIKRAKRLVFRYYVWHLQSEKAPACFLLWRNLTHKYSMYNNQDSLCRGLLTLSDWELENCPWTKKQKEARQSSKAEEEDTGGNTPTGKAKEQRNPGSCKYNLFPRASNGVRRKFDWLIAETLSYLNSIREDGTRSAKKQTTREKAPKQLKKKRDEPAEVEPVPAIETPVPEVDPIVPEAGTSSPAVEEEATGHDKSVQKEDARQKKRSKKQANLQLVYEGCFREDVYFPMKNRCVIVKSSLKETHDLLHGNKTKTIKDHVPIVEELKKMCAALDSKRAGGFLMNNKQVPTAADCLYLDLPTGLKIDEDDIVPT